MAEQNSERWKRVLAPLAGVAVGFAAGAVFGGGRLVRIYDWSTEWNIDAPRSEVFRVLSTPEEQRHWWPSMVVERVEPIPENPRRACHHLSRASGAQRAPDCATLYTRLDHRRCGA